MDGRPERDQPAADRPGVPTEAAQGRALLVGLAVGVICGGLIGGIVGAVLAGGRASQPVSTNPPVQILGAPEATPPEADAPEATPPEPSEPSPR